MVFIKVADFVTKLMRTRNKIPASRPEPIQRGTVVLSSDLSVLSVCKVGGHLAGDNFLVQFTAGSNLVTLPNNALSWSGLKLYSPQFPNGVMLTGKTSVVNQYTIGTNATLTKQEVANFCVLNSVKLKPFLAH